MCVYICGHVTECTYIILIWTCNVFWTDTNRIEFVQSRESLQLGVEETFSKSYFSPRHVFYFFYLFIKRPLNSVLSLSNQQLIKILLWDAIRPCAYSRDCLSGNMLHATLHSCWRCLGCMQLVREIAGATQGWKKSSGFSKEKNHLAVLVYRKCWLLLS